MKYFTQGQERGLDPLQQVATKVIAVLVILTFIATNAQALLWQSSDWLVGTVLPAVVVDLTNNERSDITAAPLRRSAALDQAATQKAAHMAANGYFSHFAPDGTSPWYFFDQAGYVYAHAGENLAIHFTDSSELVEAWMKSPAHKENIVNRNFTEIGVGTARGTFDGYETVFVVQLFGSPAAQPNTMATPTTPPAPVPEPTVPTNTQSDTLETLRAELEALQAQADTLAQTPPAQDPEPAPAALTLVPEPELAETEVLAAADDQPSASADTDTPAATPEPAASSVPTPTEPVLVIATELATSSGLAIASVTEDSELYDRQSGSMIASVITRPNLVLDIVYSLLLSLVIVLLLISLLGETKRLHYAQAAYSLLLIGGVGGLWFMHTTLTSGAVVL